MNVVNQESNFSKQAHLFVQRPNQKLTALKNSYANKKVKNVWVKKVNTAKPKAEVNAAKAKAKHNADKGKRDYEEIDGRYVAFGGNPKRGKITGKEKPSESDGFKKIVDFINANQIKYALTVVIIEASIQNYLKLNDAEGTSCLSNDVIFEELARMSTMASAIICLANNQKFNFSKYILNNLKKNLEVGVPFYMFPRFIQVFVNHQLGDMSHHKGIFVNPSLTKKVFANIKRVGTGFSRAVKPLFGTMMVQALKEVDDLPTAVQDIPIPDTPSSFQHQRKHKPIRKESEVSPTEIHTEDHVPITSNDSLPSGEDRMKLKELMELCTNLSNKVLDLENKAIEMKSSHKAKIEELESRVEKLVEENMSLTKELKSVNTRFESQTIKETIVNKEESSKQERKIADIDADVEVNLENVYNLDMAHEETVLSMQDVIDADVKEVVEEMVEVIEIAKIIIDKVSTAGGELNAANEKPVSAAPTNITTAQPSEAIKTIVDITTSSKAKVVVFHDKEESTTRTASLKSQVKDKGKAKLVEEPKILK
uniref:Synaptobrevin, longin-like domain protein n=1 Tax=Tanacetum cinerariifolium TaxID=118510 RepID=A0A6L2L7K9_TANCI|nr:hypothetical protein [Tanacetum cinerariifolium]